MKVKNAVVFINKIINTIMSGLTILPDISDITYFLSAGEDKSKNDELNKIRENVIANMFNLDEEYFGDEKYGKSWTDMYNKFNKTVNSLCSQPFDSIKIQHKGGMAHNHDFMFKFVHNDVVVSDQMIEFKHNNANVSDLIQFLELYDKDCKGKYSMCEVSYSEYYYDNYLDNYINCDVEITEPKPEREVYLKNVCDIKYKHPFFKNLHEKKNNMKNMKKVIADESRKKYIDTYISTFKFDKLTEKIRESQKDKVFLLWDCENFHTQILDVEKIKITSFKNVNDLYFDLVVENFEYDIRVRLNWGNTVGLANPRWKFTFINK